MSDHEPNDELEPGSEVPAGGASPSGGGLFREIDRERAELARDCGERIVEELNNRCAGLGPALTHRFGQVLERIQYTGYTELVVTAVGGATLNLVVETRCRSGRALVEAATPWEPAGRGIAFFISEDDDRVLITAPFCYGDSRVDDYDAVLVAFCPGAVEDFRLGTTVVVCGEHHKVPDAFWPEELDFAPLL